MPAQYDAGVNRGLGVPAGFYHFAFEAGSPAALAEKRDELRAKGVETTDIVDHQWAQSIYFKDPNGLSLEYCCMVGKRPAGDVMMHGAFTVRRDALDLGKALSADVAAAKSARGKRKARTVAQQSMRARCAASLFGPERMVRSGPRSPIRLYFGRRRSRLCPGGRERYRRF